jgi:hypothetical protein
MHAARPQFDDALLDQLARCYARAAVRAYIREMEAELTQPENERAPLAGRPSGRENNEERSVRTNHTRGRPIP